MRILVTGSAGHLGEALVRDAARRPADVVGLDILASPYTDVVGSIADRGVVRRVHGRRRRRPAHRDAAQAARRHPPRQEFVDTNVTGTLNLLEEAVAAGVGAFVFTSTTSAFGRALTPAAGAPAAWITEDVVPVPKNIYGVTKVAAEDLCELSHRDHGLPCLVLRTSRFFPEPDDSERRRAGVRRREPQGQRAAVPAASTSRTSSSAHLLASSARPQIGFGRYIISATTPFTRDDLARAARRCAGGRAAAVSPTTDALRSAGLADVPGHRPRLRQRPGARELGGTPRYDFVTCSSACGLGEDPTQPSGAGGGGKGLPRGDAPGRTRRADRAEHLDDGPCLLWWRWRRRGEIRNSGTEQLRHLSERSCSTWTAPSWRPSSSGARPCSSSPPGSAAGCRTTARAAHGGHEHAGRDGDPATPTSGSGATEAAAARPDAALGRGPARPS